MKTYFIGLGGCGLKTVSEIQKRLRVLPNAEKDYAFTYIDTDEKTYNTINEKEIIISSTDFKNMGDTNPLAVYNNAYQNKKRNANEDRLLEWVICQEPGHMVLANSPLNDGAKAFRNLGRIAIFNKYDYIANELSTKIKGFEELEPNPETNTRDVDIWVIASSCGGTGSSNLLDVLYMINSIANPVVSGSGEPNLKLVLFMPQPFVDKNKDNKNYPLNAYSCLWELNAFRTAYENGNKQTYEHFAVRPTKIGEKVLDFPLYKFAIPVDVETNANSKLNVDTNFYPTIAEMIYYMTTGNGANALCSNLSNDIAHLERVNGQTRSMVGYGFRAIKKANLELKEYLVKRGIYEVLEYGLLDESSSGMIEDEKVKFANDVVLSKLVKIDKTNIYLFSIEFNTPGICESRTARFRRQRRFLCRLFGRFPGRSGRVCCLGLGCRLRGGRRCRRGLRGRCCSWNRSFRRDRRRSRNISRSLCRLLSAQTFFEILFIPFSVVQDPVHKRFVFCYA